MKELIKLKSKGYIIQIKGIKTNKFNWKSESIFDTLKEAIKHYNTYKGGCCKRIVRIKEIEKYKVMRLKNYG